MRKQFKVLLLASVTLILFFWYFGHIDVQRDGRLNLGDTKRPSRPRPNAPGIESIMPEMSDKEARKELGRSGWRLLHTILARFPEKPTQAEQDSLSDFLYLFAKLYPCGQCSKDFQILLNQHPPEVHSRDAASQWGCKIHNLVNEKIHKPPLNCSEIISMYDCGCDIRYPSKLGRPAPKLVFDKEDPTRSG
ncbi:sulfhydryl oxidase [Schizosaccharomyces japonicus yFS275]|uniref:Sulfhydryl oxidase n=1 Tax=Schizosaccharomyces japonicus (strain yFS275 / FY16936) TaxID=402676 RepID=B6K5L6_SCHJY|nr:sulfhydryl oxidase [Schizosaccharomyces japonicus yFS275]EEB08820.1 sulfhydryl oxidase [Schizosaccharomyces japonicus yFS275]